MATIKPFKALRYHRPKVENIANLLSPPYDIISPEQKKELYQRSEHNITRVDFPIPPEKGDMYEESAKLLDKWEAEQLLVTESRPAIYVTEEYYIDWEGYRRIRRGFIALLRVEDYKTCAVYPHERTFPKHKDDRRKLLRATHAMFNPVFSFYSDDDKKVSSVLKNVVDRTLPDWNFRFDDGVTRTMWSLTKPKEIETIVEAMSKRSVFIADGHHRYETALGFSSEMDEKMGTKPEDDAPYHYVLMYFVNMEDEGLSILPTHRALKDIPKFSEKDVINMIEKDFVMEEMERRECIEAVYHTPGSQAMAVQIGGKYFKIQAKPDAISANADLQKLDETVKNLNVSICEEMLLKPLIGGTENLLEHISYIVEPEKVHDRVASGEFQMAIYLAPVSINDLERTARALQVMPQKSTYFYPKLITGLVIYRF
ncbi:MAG: DUF1015 domain-containing protein, partial [bacterium]